MESLMQPLLQQQKTKKKTVIYGNNDFAFALLIL